MKLCKKVLAIALALALVVSLGAVSAFAAAQGGGMDFGSTVKKGASSVDDLKDFADVANKDAVTLLVNIGVINGIEQSDGSYKFEPKTSITREAMAKMIATAVTLASGKEITGKSGQFTDVSGRWSENYVNFCADNAIINGRGNKLFDYAGNITVAETAKLLAASLGAENLTGSGWKAAAWSVAQAFGILEGVKGGQDEAITRDEAALIIYNALTVSDGNKALPAVKVIKEDSSFETFDISKNMLLVAPADKLVTMLAEGKEVDTKVAGSYKDVKFVLTDTWDHNPSSYNGRGVENYRAALVINDKGVDENHSVTEAISAGTYTSQGASDVVIEGASDGFSAIMVENAAYTLKNAKIKMNSDSDGSDASDFSGYGAVIGAFGAKVTIEDSEIESTGVAKVTAFSDSGSDILVKNSTLKAMGGKLYDGYVNSADQTKMVAPPWVLGITGNARTVNVMGQKSSIVVVDSEVSANQWGVLSTDSGKNMQVVAIDSTVTLLGENQKDPYSEKYGSGYGSYIIGDAQEYFYGVTFNVGTYASILTGGDAWYKSSNGTIEAKSGVDESVIYTGAGKGQNTVINSDAFGFMAHNSGSLNVLDGTEVNTDNATFLIKTGGVDLNVDNAKLNSEDKIILQMIDNDDSTVGMNMATFGFNTQFSEKAGWPSDTDSVKGGSKGTVTFNATNATLDGDLFNGTGYYGQKANALEVTLGAGATLNGAIAATETIHINEEGKQNVAFSINEYYYLGHVANRLYQNDGNTVSVTLKDGAVWNVTGNSLISALTIGEGCSVTGTGLKATVNGVETALEAGKTYGGKISITVENGVSSAFAAGTAAPEPSADLSWEAYTQYLCDAFAKNAPDPEAQIAAFKAIKSWDEINLEDAPYNIIFSETLGGTTYPDWVAAGGVGGSAGVSGTAADSAE